MMKLFYLIIFILALSCTSQEQSDIQVGKGNILDATLNEFNKKIADRIDFMQQEKAMTVQDAVDMVRLSNTISFDVKLQQNESCILYEKLFFEKYMEKAVEILNALPSIGMAYYSKNHDLYIGGIPHLNSKYHIIDE